MRCLLPVALAGVVLVVPLGAQSRIAGPINLDGDPGSTLRRHMVTVSPDLPAVRLDSRTVLMAGLVATALVCRSDNEFDEELALETTGTLVRGVRRVGSLYDQWWTFPLLGGAAIWAWSGASWHGSPRAGRTATRMAEALVASSLAAWTLKRVVGRSRPYTGFGPGENEFLDFPRNADAQSFPSGHTATAFAMATVLAGSTRHPLVRAGAFAFAGSVGVQRITARRHWASDVLAGALLGYGIGQWILARHAETDRATGWSLQVSGRSAGLRFSW